MVSKFTCPRCGGATYRPLKEPRTVECHDCGQSFSPDAAGTQQQQAPAEKPTPADGLGSESREIRRPPDSIAKEPSSSESAAPQSWWGTLVGVGIFGTFAAAFFGIFRDVIFGSFFSLFGLVILGAAVTLCVSTLWFLRGAISADGIVVGFEERLEEQEESERKYSIEIGPISWSFGPRLARRVSFFPRVEFETEDHEKRVFTSDEEGLRRASVGEPVRVLYDPAQPQVAHITKHLWGQLVMCGVVAVLGAGSLLFGLKCLLVGFNFLPSEIHWE